jgi:hypothetical protein
MQSPLPIAAALLCLSLGACRDEAAPVAAAPPPVEANINPLDQAQVTASFRCQDGHRVDIVRGKVARVTLADGRAVKLELVAGSAPTTFTDNGLYFEMPGTKGATLSDEQNRTLTCSEIASR